MSVREFTLDDSSRVWDYFTSRFGTQVTSKRDDLLMGYVGGLLGNAGVTDSSAFMDSFATTIGNVIYIPFDSGSFDPWTQILVCVHEHQHVIQYKSHGNRSMSDFAWKYLISSTHRLEYEIEAYTTQIELGHAFGKPYPISAIVNALRNYNFGDVDLSVAESALRRNLRVIESGGTITDATRLAVGIL